MFCFSAEQCHFFFVLLWIRHSNKTGCCPAKDKNVFFLKPKTLHLVSLWADFSSLCHFNRHSLLFGVKQAFSQFVYLLLWCSQNTKCLETHGIVATQINTLLTVSFFGKCLDFIFIIQLQSFLHCEFNELMLPKPWQLEHIVASANYLNRNLAVPYPLL